MSQDIQSFAVCWGLVLLVVLLEFLRFLFVVCVAVVAVLPLVPVRCPELCYRYGRMPPTWGFSLGSALGPTGSEIHGSRTFSAA